MPLKDIGPQNYLICFKSKFRQYMWFEALIPRRQLIYIEHNMRVLLVALQSLVVIAIYRLSRARRNCTQYIISMSGPWRNLQGARCPPMDILGYVSGICGLL